MAYEDYSEIETAHMLDVLGLYMDKLQPLEREWLDAAAAKARSERLTYQERDVLIRLFEGVTEHD